MLSVSTVVMAATLLAVAPIAPTAAAADPLAPLQWKNRALLVFASGASDRELREQRRLFAADPAGTRERDLVLVEAIDGEAASAGLRRRFGVPATGFRAILIGKDGGGKLTASQPLGLDRLYREIDAMPMRRQEMRR